MNTTICSSICRWWTHFSRRVRRTTRKCHFRYFWDKGFSCIKLMSSSMRSSGSGLISITSSEGAGSLRGFTVDISRVAVPSSYVCLLNTHTHTHKTHIITNLEEPVQIVKLKLQLKSLNIPFMYCIKIYSEMSFCFETDLLHLWYTIILWSHPFFLLSPKLLPRDLPVFTHLRD